MVTLFDKRNAKRHGCDGEIIWSYFNKKRSLPSLNIQYFQYISI